MDRRARHHLNPSVWWAFLANMSVAVAKGAAAWLSGSGVLLAETLHSAADCGNQLLLWFGHYRARRPPSVQHPLGYGKEIYFWSFVVAILLFFGGGVLSVVEGVLRLRSPEPLKNAGWGIATILFALFAESASLRTALRQLHGIRSIGGLYQWFRNTRRNDLLMVISEDVAAVLGLLIALIALLTSMVAGQALFDAVGSILVGLLLILVAGNLIVEVKASLIGESAAESQREGILDTSSQSKGVDRVELLITLQHGGEIFVAARLLTQSNEGKLVQRTIDDCHAALRRRFQNLSQVFLEPILPVSPIRHTADACKRRRPAVRSATRGDHFELGLSGRERIDQAEAGAVPRFMPRNPRENLRAICKPARAYCNVPARMNWQLRGRRAEYPASRGDS